MNFTKQLETTLSQNHLLKHPFYQAWTEGLIPLSTLRVYASQYYHHVDAFPRYISATHSNCSDIQARQFLLENLNDEEGGTENHPELWLRFAEGLGASRSEVKATLPLPETRKLVDTFYSSCKRSYAEGLGALFAYERQVPEVATFKIEALKSKYAIEDESTLSFFEVHRKADIYHTDAITQLLNALPADEKTLASQAALQASQCLWGFLDGISATLPVSCSSGSLN